MQKLVSNMGDVAQTLGVDVNPNIDNTFDMLMKTLGAVKKLTEEGSKIPDIENLTVFGGVRQRRAPMALVALYDTLLTNIKSINLESGKYAGLLAEIDSKNKDILESVHKQAERFGNLRKMAGEAFVQGIVGGEDFNTSLKELNQIMQTSVIPSLKTLGQLFYWIIKPLDMIGTGIGMAETAAADLFMLMTGNFKSTTWGIDKSLENSVIQLRTMKGVFKALKGEFDAPLVVGIISNVKKYQKELELSDAQLNRLVSDLEKAAEKAKKLSEQSGKLAEETKENSKSQIVIRGTIKEQLNLLEREVEYVELLNEGYSKSEIATRKLTDYISEQVRIYNATQGVKEGTVQAIKAESVLSAVLNKNYEKVLGIFNQTGIQQEKLLQLEKKRLEIVKARIKEERGAPDLSSETMKLYKIAKEYGADPARRISEFLQGKMNYQQFQYRDAFKIYEKEFGAEAEKYKALDYLKRGEGRRIPIQEEALRLPDLVRKQRLKTPDGQIQIPEVPTVSAKIDFQTTIGKIEVKMPEGTQGDLAESIGKDVIESLKNNEEIAKILAKTIRPFI